MSSFNPNPLSRMQQHQMAANQPTKCLKCGGTWFHIVECAQFGSGHYSSTPGGDLSVISTTTPKVRVCLCGEAFTPNIGGVRPGRLASSETDSFMESLKGSREARAMPVKPKELAPEFPLRSEYDKLAAELAETKAIAAQVPALLSAVAELKKLVTAKPVAPPAVVTGPAKAQKKNQPVQPAPVQRQENPTETE